MEFQLSGLPVGHTHEDIDQLFSTISRALLGGRKGKREVINLNTRSDIEDFLKSKVIKLLRINREYFSSVMICSFFRCLRPVTFLFNESKPYMTWIHTLPGSWIHICTASDIPVGRHGLTRKIQYIASDLFATAEVNQLYFRTWIFNPYTNWLDCVFRELKLSRASSI